MVVRKVLSRRYELLILLALLFGSTVSAGLVGVRYVYTGRPTYAFLIWNLVLAWIPLWFACLAYLFYNRTARLNALTVYCALLWLVFLPNAPYLLTEMLHLEVIDQVPLWFDLILLQSFAWTGLFLGLISLYLMQDLVTQRFGTPAGWVFALAALSLNSFGIYLGRFVRWNSWDVLLNPKGLATDILDRLVHPLAYGRAYAVSVLLTVVFTFIYLILFALTRIPRERQLAR